MVRSYLHTSQFSMFALFSYIAMFYMKNGMIIVVQRVYFLDILTFYVLLMPVYAIRQYNTNYIR